MFDYTYWKLTLAIDLMDYIKESDKEVTFEQIKKRINESNASLDDKKDILEFLGEFNVNESADEILGNLELYYDLICEKAD